MNLNFMRSLFIAGALVPALLSELAGQTGRLVSRVASAIALLDSAETERGVDALRTVLAQWPDNGPRDLRVRAHSYLGAAILALGMRDSALAHFSEAVRLNPFAVLDPDVFNPEAIAAFREARLTTPSLGVRIAKDTVLKPLSQSYLVAVAVGEPAEIVVSLRRATGTSLGVASERLTVDSTASFVMALHTPDSIPLEPGDYLLTAEMLGTTTLSVRALLRITRQTVDTAPHEPALDSTLFRPERKKGPLAPISALSGIAFGTAAAAVPMVFGNREVDGRKAQISALSVGAGICVAGLAGVILGRRMIPINENIQYNRSLVVAWEQRNRAIAEANEAKRRLAPLRIALVEEPR